MTGPLQPPPQTHATPPPPALARRGLWAIFGATFFAAVVFGAAFLTAATGAAPLALFSLAT